MQRPAVPLELAEFAERLDELLGAVRADAVLASMTAAKRAGYYVNRLQGGGPLPGDVAVPQLPQYFLVPEGREEELGRTPEAGAGAVYPMNASSLLPVLSLAPCPGEEVLDLAAAPGGKTLLIAAAMDNSGRIAAVEPVKARFHRLRANLERCGVSNVAYYMADGRGVGRKVPERFDAVLLDAPCSSEARMRLAEPTTYSHWKPRKVKEAARKQRGLLRSAFAALKPGGRLVYSTCAYAAEENEANVAALLDAEPRAELCAVEFPGVPSMPGVTQWRSQQFGAQLQLTLRVLPDSVWDGFFVAKLRKSG